jgi:hypothetical protein
MIQKKGEGYLEWKGKIKDGDDTAPNYVAFAKVFEDL